MKKSIRIGRCIILIFVTIFIASFSSFAAINTEVDFNIDDYTEDELIEIMTRIQQGETNLGYQYSSDVLLVGEDIPAGHYEFWIEEDDIEMNQTMIDKIDNGIDYHCGATELCSVRWSKEQDNWGDYEYAVFYYDDFGVHQMVELEEGDYLWTTCYNGINYIGFRMKYMPFLKSGLF